MSALFRNTGRGIGRTGRRAAYLALPAAAVALLQLFPPAALAACSARFASACQYARGAVATGKSGVVSISAAVARDGRSVWQEGFGWVDKERRVRASAHTPYSLASVSKPITATALMKLVEAGKIDLARPINDYLPASSQLTGRPGAADLATVCRVASHTSGLSTHGNFYYADEAPVKPAMDETIRRYGKLIGVPGERYVYSNLGYGILGHVVGTVSGMGYAGYLSQEIFGPLGMTDSRVDPSPARDAAAPRYDSDGKELPFYDFDHPGASAIYASAHDLVKFAMLHLGERTSSGQAVLSAASIDRMRRSGCGDDAHDAYGIGWRLDELHGLQVVSHSGGMPGVRTLLLLVPERRIAVAVLANRSGRADPSEADVIAWPIANRVLHALIPNWPADYVAQRPASAPAAGFPQALVGTWTGSVETYASERPLVLQFLASGEVLATLGNEPAQRPQNVRFADRWIEGDFAGDLGTDDLDRRGPYALTFSLRLDDAEHLRGTVSARSSGPGRFHFVLPHWTTLARTAAAAQPR